VEWLCEKPVDKMDMEHNSARRKGFCDITMPDEMMLAKKIVNIIAFRQNHA
jgi:hypothetical protein